ncbi:MAG: sulfur carrier protein ThiS [Actinomycetota bacterium]
MTVTTNGKPRELPGGATIQSFLDSVGWKAEWVVVEHNGEPLERTKYAITELREGDKLEVVKAVAGG